MKNQTETAQPQFKYIPCECCEYPVAVPADAAVEVCIACPQCGHRSCS